MWSDPKVCGHKDVLYSTPFKQKIEKGMQKKNCDESFRMHNFSLKGEEYFLLNTLHLSYF